MKKNVEDYLVKPNWYRRATPQGYEPYNTIAQPVSLPQKSPLVPDSGSRVVVTQSQMLDELDPNSHLIYNIYGDRPNRPKFKFNEKTQKNECCGFEKVARVAVALQNAILTRKVAHTFGNPVWFGSEEQDYADEIAVFKSMWNESGMNNALMEFGRAAFGVAEGAIYLYRDEDKIKYKVFSFENGDIFAPYKTRDDEGIVRTYFVDGKKFVEFYGKKDIEIWVKDETDEQKSADLIKWLKDAYKTIKGERSNDGYILIKVIETGLTQCPVAYHRERDTCWGSAQSNIQSIEELLSDLMENGKYYNFQILFLTGGLVNLPNANFMGKVIGSQSKDGDAKILAPADASNTFSISLEQQFKAMCMATNTVIIDHKELKGQNDSGAYLRNLYHPEEQWSMLAYARMHPFFAKLFSIFQEYTGLIKGDVSRFQNMRYSYQFTPHIPQNLTEEIQNINNSVASGTLSLETACEEHPMANPQEYRRIKSEINDKPTETVVGIREEESV